MKAVCFESVQKVSQRDIPDPIIEDSGDAIVQVNLAGLCGSDLHPFFGRELGIAPGTVMGHEFVGKVVELGAAVKNFQTGDRICSPFTTNCGRCLPCQNGLTSRCDRGQLFGWREQGTGLHGGQSQYVRVPLADSTLMKIPSNMSDDIALLLGDNLSTGFFCAEMAGIQPAGVYVVIGCGTVGLLAIQAAKILGANTVIAVDPLDSRRQIARQIGAITCDNLNDVSQLVADHTGARGADAVMELVGLPNAQKMAIDLLSVGGTLSVIGCHCSPNFAFSPAQAYDKNLTYRTGRCPARHYMGQLASRLAQQPMNLDWAITHRFGIHDAEAAYETFAYRKDDCVKAVIEFP
ncbi:alcohol dehydrogenase catalytic domain-containing protein [Planctomycetes bacterium K23_9]|uniref:NADP-dependent isopropanol dehydrogenase n=1 Tax=Stieleria marina TaxID=1930275 RepID=A0A517NMU7_9BACT|nr:NADP-dependent isopropanol dehydrogenase [Planctomycetes bacterium K23_9]